MPMLRVVTAKRAGKYDMELYGIFNRTEYVVSVLMLTVVSVRRIRLVCMTKQPLITGLYSGVSGCIAAWLEAAETLLKVQGDKQVNKKGHAS